MVSEHTVHPILINPCFVYSRGPSVPLERMMRAHVFLLVLCISVWSGQAYRKFGRCGWVKCEKECRKVRDDKGCFKCECGPESCPPLECGPGCLEVNTFNGPCPRCQCTKEEEAIEVEDIKRVLLCPRCPAGCLEEAKSDGQCPGCECKDNVEDIAVAKKIICDPPKCAANCEVEKVYDGPCPSCVCQDNVEDLSVARKIICDPPNCASNCEVEKIYDGPCPGCVCKDNVKDIAVTKKIICDPPKCAANCEVEKVYDGPCPGCVCKDVKCPPAEPCFGAGCHLEKDESGCEICECRLLCSPPKCKRFCSIRTNEGGCPTCECPKWRKWG